MRIGLVLNILDEEYQISIYNGIKHRAEAIGVDLVCFQQDSNSVTSDAFLHNYSKNEYFALDGVILLTSVIIDNYQLNHKIDVEKIFGSIPVVSIGVKIPDVTSLLVKTDESMRSLVDHLLNFHNYRNFLYISGSQLHDDAINREKVFTSVIKENQTKNQNLRYTLKRGWFRERAASIAIDEYLQENNGIKPDVVVCANDNMALGVRKFFKQNQNRYGTQECAVTGFDDIPQAEFEFPALTTVRQPLTEIGIKSVDTIVKMIKEGITPEDVIIESQLMIRESCGCCKNEKSEVDPDSLRKIQENYVVSESLLRMLSHIGQELNNTETVDEMNLVIHQNLEQLDIQNFCLVRFDAPCKKINSNNDETFYVEPLYVRRRGIEVESFYKKQKIHMGDFYKQYLELYNDISLSLVLKYLIAGSEIIGFALYDANDNSLSYLSSITINISQTLNRIYAFEEKKRHSEFLESEVKKRSRELMEANEKRLKVEAEVLKISEIERQRFSNDLHDDICQRLAGISMLCRSYSAGDSNIEKKQMVELAELINDTLQRTRQYAHNSYPVELDSLGLNYSISNLCNAFEKQSEIKCDYVWKVSDRINFTKLQKLNIFRIVQEALHNIMKHSRAKSVCVNIESKKNQIMVCVCDDGCGIKENANNSGLGLSSMEYRANQIGASFSITNNYPTGTCINLLLTENPSFLGE